MTELQVILLVVTATGVVSLTVLVLGLLRSVTDVRLTLSGHGDAARSGLRTAAGRVLPDVEGTRWQGDSYLVFASATCPGCLGLLQELDRVDGELAVIPTNSAADEVRPHVSADVPVLADARAQALVAALGVTELPFVLAQRDGIVLGHLSGESASAARQLNEFRITLGVRPLQEVPS